MASEFFTDIASTCLSKTLDAAAARQKAIANNIANIETPGYKRIQVSFEDQLKSILSEGNKNQVREGLKILQPLSQMDDVSPSRPDGNNVNIDAEVADMNKTILLNRAATTLLESKAALIRAAISEGKR